MFDFLTGLTFRDCDVVAVVVVVDDEEGVVRDKLVFGMLKHGHVPFQILTRYFYSLDFGTQPLTNTLLILSDFYFLLP